MSYDEFLTERIKNCLKEKRTSYEEKFMFGGWCAMVNGKMCVGVVKNELMARIGPDQYEACLSKSGARPMDFNGRPMMGYVFVSTEALDFDHDLAQWIDVCLTFNPMAKSSSKKENKIN